jgi:predicted kinase
MLILILGLPGSGKTTLADAYCARFGALHLNSDVIRRELGLLGQYDPEAKKKVYDALMERTRKSLFEGREVVVGSTFYKESVREPFRRVAAECKVPSFWVEVLAEENTVRERMKKPRADSEADFAIYEKIKAEYEPLEEPHLVVWSDKMPLEKMTEAVREYVTSPRTS